MAKYEKWLEEDGLILITGWARDGLSEEQIAHNMHIAPSTLREWKHKFPAISAAIKKGKEVVDYIVENALFESAIEGNTTAQIFWLKNRRPHAWRDKPVDTGNEETLEKIRLLLGGIESAIN